MKRYQIYCLNAFVGIVGWLLLMFMRKDYLQSVHPALSKIAEIFPFFLLIGFGSACLGKLGYDLTVFREDPTEILALEKVRGLLFKGVDCDQNISYFVLLKIINSNIRKLKALKKNYGRKALNLNNEFAMCRTKY